MALTSERKISILIIGTFLVGMIIGLFFARVHELRNNNDTFTFTTQSVEGEEVTVMTRDVSCPREKEIRKGEQIVFANPLGEKAGKIFSLQRGIFSENYTLRGPTSNSKDARKGQLIQRTVDNVTAGMEKGNALCVYSSLGDDIVLLRQDSLGDDCEAITTPSFVGFSCPVKT